MKKVIAVLAVLAVAAAAQAEILTVGTWSSNGVATSYADTHITVHNLGVSGGSKTTQGGIYGLNTLSSGGGFEFSYTLDDSWYIKDATISGIASGSTRGPAKMDWYVDGAIVTGQSVTRTSNRSASFSNDLGDLKKAGADGGVVKLLADTTAGSALSTTTINDGGTFNLRGAIIFFSLYIP